MAREQTRECYIAISDIDDAQDLIENSDLVLLIKILHTFKSFYCRIILENSISSTSSCGSSSSSSSSSYFLLF